MHSRKGKDTVENDKRFEIDTTSQNDEQTREGDESYGQDRRVQQFPEHHGLRGKGGRARRVACRAGPGLWARWVAKM